MVVTVNQYSKYKQILVYRLVNIKCLQYSTDQTGHVADIARIRKEYNMIEHINSFIENGIVMSKGEWKKVNDQVNDKENKEWTATSVLHRELNDFKSTGINLKKGCPWWKVTRLDFSCVRKIKVIWKLLMTNNIKSGYNCDCFSTKCWTHTV